MSNLERTPELRVCGGLATTDAQPTRDVIPGRLADLGGGQVRRLLPTLGRRMVGAWCFLDHYGPDDIAAEPGMQVAPHPHMGLQTVSWLLDGEILHRDSLGSEQVFRPGELGLMTSGRAIAHAEQSPPVHPRLLHGCQLWVALPDAVRDTAPAWEHHAVLPHVVDGGLDMTVFMGESNGLRSPGTAHTPLLGADIRLAAGTDTRLPLEPDFEHAAIVVDGSPEIDGVALPVGSLLDLGCGRHDLALRADTDSRLMLLGGEPFDEQIVMWWNFVGRSGEEIAAARTQWEAGERFGPVAGWDSRIPAPPLPPGTLKARGRVR